MSKWTMTALSFLTVGQGLSLYSTWFLVSVSAAGGGDDIFLAFCQPWQIYPLSLSASLSLIPWSWRGWGGGRVERGFLSLCHVLQLCPYSSLGRSFFIFLSLYFFSRVLPLFCAYTRMRNCCLSADHVLSLSSLLGRIVCSPLCTYESQGSALNQSMTRSRPGLRPVL